MPTSQNALTKKSCWSDWVIIVFEERWMVPSHGFRSVSRAKYCVLLQQLYNLGDSDMIMEKTKVPLRCYPPHLQKKSRRKSTFLWRLQHIRAKEEEEKSKWKPQRETSRYTSPLSHTIVSLCLFHESLARFHIAPTCTNSDTERAVDRIVI